MLDFICRSASRRPRNLRARRIHIAAAVLFIACLVHVRPAGGQVVYSGDKGGLNLSAGVTASGYQVQYGEQKLLGITALVDADTRRRIGIEGEARWLRFHETNGENLTTWSIGPRYHVTRGRLQFYGKGLVGLGQFTFPYNYAHGSYLVISPGGGLDYHWSHRLTIRAADFEYQYWPQFTFGSMTTYGLSTGIRYRVF